MTDSFDKTIPEEPQGKQKPQSGSTLAMGSGGSQRDVSLDATVAADLNADTLPSDGPPVADGVKITGPGRAATGLQGTGTGAAKVSSAQNTVLPRVEFDGRTPKFVVEPTQRYQVIKTIGEGGVGEVVSARDNDIARKVALKRLRADMQAPVALARFVEEIRTTGRLEHPNIIPIHDVGVDEAGNYYFIMKYVDGETLESIIDKLRAGDKEYHKRYGFERRVEIFKGVLEAVAYAHSQGFIHRDIKPANIMVGPFGEVLLMDWGIAKHIGDSDAKVDAALLPADPGNQAKEEDRKFHTQVGSLIGTPAYMAPEQARGEPADQRSDIYALCVTMHEFLTLQHYLSGKRTLKETLEGVMNEPVPQAAFMKNPYQKAVSADLGWFINGGVTKDPNGRYPTVEAMIQRLDRRAEGHIPIQCPMTFMKATTNWWLRLLDGHPRMVVVGVSLLALSVVAGVVYGVLKLT